MDSELDQVIGIQNDIVTTSPERATFIYRLSAEFVDGVIVNIPLRIIQIFLLASSLTLFYVVTLIVYIWYFAYYPFKHNGQTFGKKWNRVRMVRLDGDPLSFNHLIARELTKFGIIVISAKLFGIIGIYLGYATYLLALTNSRLALHDIIARTQVIKVDR